MPVLPAWKICGASIILEGKILNWDNVTFSIHFSGNIVFESLCAADSYAVPKYFIRCFFFNGNRAAWTSYT